MKRRNKAVRGMKALGNPNGPATPGQTDAKAGRLRATGGPGVLPVPDESALDEEIVTSSPEETFELGRTIAGKLTAPAIILLSGDLGAGKTVLTKGIAAGLDIDPNDVTSPSFTLINLHQGRLRLYHVDLYRLDVSDLPDLGLEEIFEDPGAITIIEWADRLPQVRKKATRIQIEYLDGTSRKILML